MRFPSHRAGRLAGIGVVLATVASAPAGAQTRDPKEAQVWVDAGMDHYRAGRYEKAVQSFRKAFTAIREPVLTWNIARCYEELGDVPNAVHYFEVFVERHPQDRSAPDARQKLAALRPRLPGAIRVACGTEPTAVVRIDGDREATCDRPSKPWAPGPHTVEARSPRLGVWEGVVQVPPEGQVEVAVDWSQARRDAAAAAPADASPRAAPEAAPRRRTWKDWATTGAVVGGALLLGAGAAWAIVQPGRVEVPSTSLGQREVLQ